MRSPTEKVATADRRKAERRGAAASSKSGAQGDRRVVEQRGMAHAMVDALEDILKYERASERALRVAQASSSESN
jgi:hypothetical protein